MAAVVMWVSLLAWSFLIMGALRAGQVCGVRLAFIDSPYLYEKYYEKLPSLARMVYHPRHWLRWSEYSWRQYVGATPKTLSRGDFYAHDLGKRVDGWYFVPPFNFPWAEQFSVCASTTVWGCLWMWVSLRKRRNTP